MFDIGFLEMIVVAIIALLVLGPEQLPQAARTGGKFVMQLKQTMNQLSATLEEEVNTKDLADKLKHAQYQVGVDQIDLEGEKIGNHAIFPYDIKVADPKSEH